MNGPAGDSGDRAPPLSARLPMLVSLGGGLAASGVAWAVMAMARATFGVRTLPERVVEWLLLFVPLDVFEAGLRRFGFSAKRYALFGAVVMMVILLTALGAVAVRRRWSGPALGALGLGLWLITMTTIMPLTGAGLFAMNLLQGTGAAIAGYLVVALAYAGALATARALAEAVMGAESQATARTSAALLAGSAVAAWACIPFVARWSPLPRLPAAVVPLVPAGQESASSGRAGSVAAGGPEIAGARSVAPPLVSSAPPLPSPTETAAVHGPWNTANLDALTNGNVNRAWELVAAFGVPAATATAGDSPGPPWRDIGAVHEYTGTVERLRTTSSSRSILPWSSSQRAFNEAVLTGAVEAGRMPVVCLTFADSAAGANGVREGDQARARGYLVGVANTENRIEGSTTALVIVGEVMPR